MRTNTLTEIKKGQTGTGLLIEQDGYVSLDIKNNRQLTESVVNEDGIRELPRPFVVHAVFQKYGIENGNGRVYPEHVLKRAVEQYQTAIQERRAVGKIRLYRPPCRLYRKRRHPLLPQLFLPALQKAELLGLQHEPRHFAGL